jgi:hypothetical protein
MTKAEKILEKHVVLNDCIGYLGSDGRLYKAIIDALNEAINYTHSCETLPDKALNIDQEEFINNCQDYFGGKPNTNNQR